ncbi:pyridoxal phosphate-dependent aminotransferase [Actinocrispum sp. NPDC049592]|uniref:pyridoxal phosphate-dependent aminotransferase n=1 Tax=Actinocrispum sp. NPDC049592 TaxID=3154835 RepID=UPI00343D7EBC
MLTAPSPDLTVFDRQLPPVLHSAVLDRLAATPWHHYPLLDPELRERVAAHYGVSAANVLPTRGCTEALEMAVRHTTRRGISSLALPWRSWYGFVPLAERAGLSWTHYDVGTLPEPGHIPVLCTPNNPTGHVIAEADLARLCAEPAIVDCTYDDLSEDPVLPRIGRFLNGEAIFCTSLAKSTGLAAARLGLLFAAAGIVAKIEAEAGPHRLDAFQLAALDTLFSVDGLRAWQSMVDHVRAQRAACADHIRTLLPCGTVTAAVGTVVYVSFDPDCRNHVPGVVAATEATVFPIERVLRVRVTKATVNALAALRNRSS